MKLEEDANKCFLTNVDGKIMNKTVISKPKTPKLLIDISSHSAMFPAVDFTQVIIFIRLLKMNQIKS